MFFFHSKLCIFVASFGWMETKLLGKRRILRRKRVRLNNDGVVGCSGKLVVAFAPKTPKDKADKRSMIFWGAIRSDGKKMLIKCPTTLNSYGYLEILKQCDRQLNIPDLVFQQDNATVHAVQKMLEYVAV